MQAVRRATCALWQQAMFDLVSTPAGSRTQIRPPHTAPAGAACPAESGHIGNVLDVRKGKGHLRPAAAQLPSLEQWECSCWMLFQRPDHHAV